MIRSIFRHILFQCFHPEKTKKSLHSVPIWEGILPKTRIYFDLLKHFHICWHKYALYTILLLQTDALNPCPSSMLIAVFCFNIKHSSVTAMFTINSFWLFSWNRKNLFSDQHHWHCLSFIYLLFPPRNPANRNCPMTAEIFINSSEFHFIMLNWLSLKSDRRSGGLSFFLFCLPWSGLTGKKTEK